MDPILVPAPPRSAYNANRRVSDLLFHQLKHFQHIERKRKDLGIPDAISRDIYTEAGAARYIAAVTNALRGVPPAPIKAVPAPSIVKVPPKKTSAKKAAPKQRTAKKSKARK